MNEAVEADGAGRQAGRRPCVDSISFWNLWLAVWRFSAKMLMALPRDQRGEELSRFMRMFIKTEHGPEAPTPAHPFDLPPCKLNKSVYLLGHFSQSVRQGFVVGAISLDSPTAAEKAKFICLFIFCHAAFVLCAAVGRERKGKNHPLYIYIWLTLLPSPIHHVYICAI